MLMNYIFPMVDFLFSTRLRSYVYVMYVTLILFNLTSSGVCIKSESIASSLKEVLGGFIFIPNVLRDLDVQL